MNEKAIELQNRLCSQTLCDCCALGRLTREPFPINGGLLHKMYDIMTETGRYAVKELNAEIMRRRDAFDNITQGEAIAHALAEDIHVSAANMYHKNYIQESDSRFYLIYDFIDGITLPPGHVTPEHDRKIGEVTAKIHNADLPERRIPNSKPYKARTYDWNGLAEQGRKRKRKWYILFSEHTDKLYSLTDISNKANAALSGDTVISHRDLDSKNVLWGGGEPIVIDWESAGHINKQLDFTETALYWSRHDCTVDFDCLSAFISGYKSIGEIECNNWQIPIEAGLSSKLGWLAYNIGRSLGSGGENENEQRLGTEKILSTVADILCYENKITELYNALH